MLVLEYPREKIATRTRKFVYQQNFRSKNARRQPHGFAARYFIGNRCTKTTHHQVNHVIIKQAATVKAFIDHSPLFILLRKIIAVKVVKAAPTSIGYPYITQFAMGKPIHFSAIG